MEEQLPAIELRDLIDTRDDLPPVWVAYPGSETFQVLMRPLTGARHQEMIEAAQKIEWDTVTMTKQVKLDQDHYRKLFGELVLVDWRGLKLADLKRLVVIADFKKAFLARKKEFACDAAAKELLLFHSPPFKTWAERTCRDVARYNAEREEQAEKK